MPPDVPVQQQAAWQYGVLGVVCLLFVYAIIHLWKTSRADISAGREDAKKAAEERTALLLAHQQKQTELAQASFERLKEIADDFAVRIKEERDANRAHEDLVRREFAELMEHITSESSKTNLAQTAVLEKMYDRLVRPH